MEKNKKRFLLRDSSGTYSWSVTLVGWVALIDMVFFTLDMGLSIDVSAWHYLLGILNSGVLVKFMAREVTTKILAAKNGNGTTAGPP